MLPKVNVFDYLPRTHTLLIVAIISLSSVLLSEAATKFLCARRPEIQQLSTSMVKTKTKLDAEMAKNGSGSSKKLDALVKEYQDQTSAYSRMMIIPNLLPMVLMTITLLIFINPIRGDAAGTLPFTPFSLLQKLTQQGASFEDPRTFSVGFWHFFCLAFFRSTVKVFSPDVHTPSLMDLSVLNKPKAE